MSPPVAAATADMANGRSSWCLQAGPYVGEISALCFVPHTHFDSCPLLLAGTGPQILVYEAQAGILINSFRVFEGIRVHGILCCEPGLSIPSSRASMIKIAVYGEKKVKLFSLRLEFANAKSTTGLAFELTLINSLPSLGHWVMDLRFLKVRLMPQTRSANKSLLTPNSEPEHLFRRMMDFAQSLQPAAIDTTNYPVTPTVSKMLQDKGKKPMEYREVRSSSIPTPPPAEIFAPQSIRAQYSTSDRGSRELRGRRRNNRQMHPQYAYTEAYVDEANYYADYNTYHTAAPAKDALRNVVETVPQRPFVDFYQPSIFEFS